MIEFDGGRDAVKTIVDIPDELMDRAMKAGHAKTPQELVIQALEEFARQTFREGQMH